MKLVRFDTPEALSDAAAALLTEEFERPSDIPHAVMLSGGRTPLAAYAKVAASGAKAHRNARAFFSDERMVPIDSAESNYAAALPMLDALEIPLSRVIRVRSEEPLNTAAAAYAADIELFLKKGGRIPVGLLGLGPDGHTASLFSIDDVERGRDRFAIPVRRPSGPDRVSVTPMLLRRVERVIFLVSGADKADILGKLLKNSQKIPAGLAVKGHGGVEVWRG